MCIRAINDLESAQKAYTKALEKEGKEGAAASKQQDVEKCQARVESSKVELDQVSEQLLAEYDRFKAEKAATS